VIVADGLSTATKYFLASDSTIKIILYYLNCHQTEIDISSTICNAIKCADAKLRSGYENTINMKSTLCIILIHEKEKFGYYYNVGDSRNYKSKSKLILKFNIKYRKQPAQISNNPRKF